MTTDERREKGKSDDRTGMSSPARSSASAASASGQVGVGGDDPSSSSSSFHFPIDLLSAQDRKEEALTVLKEELRAALQEEVKSLDEDSWKFAGPRSQIHLISRPCAFPLKHPWR